MTVQVISDTVQRFNGESYYKCGFYFQRKGRRLHRAVWEYHNGEIPHGFHVHHIDGDRSNNAIENLRLMDGHEHICEHARTEERRENGKRAIKFAREPAAAWHRSEEGRRWHSESARKAWEKKGTHTRACAWCGGEYETRDSSHNGQDTYCCPKHKAAALRWRRSNEGKTDYPMRKG